jgi:predicted nucleic acid-binding protein
MDYGEISQRIYVDSNVFLNFLFEVHERPDLVDSSIETLENIGKCKYFLIVSDSLVREIKKVTKLSYERITMEIFRPYDIIKKIEWVKLTRKVADEAVYLSSIHGIHRTDAIHAAMASMYDCWLVTFDNDLKTAAKNAGIEVYDPRDLV